MIPELRAQGDNPAYVRDWKFNPFAPVGNPIKFREHLVQDFANAEDLPSFSRDVFALAVDKVFEKFGVFTQPLPLAVNPTATDFILAVKALDPSVAQRVVKNTILVRLEGWRRLCGDWAVPWNLEELARRTVLFPLSDFNTKSRRIFIQRIQGPLFAIREQQSCKDRTLLLHEEGRLIYAAEGHSHMAEDIALMRAEGLWIYCLVQSTRNLHPVLLENTAVRSLGPVGHPSIAKQMATAMNLRPEHLEVLPQLPIGTFIETYLFVPHPVLVRPVYHPLRQPTAQELYAAEHALDDMVCRTRDEAHRIDLGLAAAIGDDDLDDHAAMFLLGIHEHEDLSIVERFQRHKMNPRKGSDLKKWCVAHGYVVEMRVPLGLGGSPVLLQLTAKAQAALNLPTVNTQVVHSYAKRRIAAHLASLGFVATEELDGVDVLVETATEKVAVEVEISATNAEVNLRRNVIYDQIVVVGIGASEVKRLRRKLAPIIKKLGIAPRVRFMALGAILKSDRSIWESVAKSDDTDSTVSVVVNRI